MVTNEGPSIVTSVMVTDSIPTGFTLSSATTSTGTNQRLYNSSLVVDSLRTIVHQRERDNDDQGHGDERDCADQYRLSRLRGRETCTPTNNMSSAAVYFVTAAQRTLSVATQSKPGAVTVTWPVSDANFTLQVNTNLSMSNGWQAPTNASFVTNGVNEFTNGPPFPPAEFFRLLGP